MNNLTITQLSTVLNSIVSQATGKTNLGSVATKDFVSVAQMGLKAGYDPLLGAISQVLSKTIFSVRPYKTKFGGIEVSTQKYGNITRKISISDKPFTDDNRLPLTDGVSVDMYKVNKPLILQLNFYGESVYSKNITLFKDQLDTAFSSAEEFGSFISMIMSNANDLLEQARENLARASIANFITGKTVNDARSVIHLLSEYNDLTGLSLTYETVHQPANYRPFIQWAYARIASISSLMTERSTKFHVNVTNGGGTYNPTTKISTGGVDRTVARHTPKAKQKAYILAENKYQIDTMALANTYNDEYLKGLNSEVINFWQSIDEPSKITTKPVYLVATGELIESATDVTLDKVFGLIFDEEALGYTLVNQWNAPTPFNADGGYSNIFWHETCRYWNDFTENGVVFMLD